MEREDKSHTKSKSKSKSSSKLSSKKQLIQDNASDDISMSQLELLANKKKLNKKSEEISIEKNSSKKKIEVKEISIKKSSSSRKLSSTSDSSSDHDKRDRRKINKENKNESIRKEKSDILFKLYSIVERSSGRWVTKMSMENSLDEIRGEFTRIKATLDNEGMVKFCKHGLVMGIKGIEMLNNSYDPLGVDLDGWGEAISYNMSTTEYDEVLAELCEKYKGTGSMSPEIKLLVMIVMSGAMFSFTKKAAKDPSTLSNLMSSFMNKGKAQPQPPLQRPQSPQQSVSDFNIQQQMQQNQMQQNQMQQNQMQQNQMQQNQMQQMHQQQMYQRQQMHQQDAESEDSDNIPSKLRGPVFDTPDSINIENIIKTMKEKSKKKENKKSEIDIDKILNGTDSDGDSIVRDIPAPKRGKGKLPKKTKIIKNT